MAELAIEVIRDFEEMGLKYTTVENLQIVAGALSHMLAVITNFLIFLHA